MHPETFSRIVVRIIATVDSCSDRPHGSAMLPWAGALRCVVLAVDNRLRSTERERNYEGGSRSAHRVECQICLNTCAELLSSTEIVLAAKRVSYST